MVSAKKCYTTFKLETISRLKNKLLTILLFPNVVLQVKRRYEMPVCNCWIFFQESYLGKGLHFSMDGRGAIFQWGKASFLGRELHFYLL